MNAINKDFLFETVFADLPPNWLAQATGFRYSAEALFNGNTIAAGKKMCSTLDIGLSNFALRVACYLQAHSIELYLKALYCLARLPGEAATEEHSHNMPNLVHILRTKNILPLTDVIHDETIRLAYLLSRWYGRYFKPKFGNSENEKNRILRELFEKPSDNNMVKAKYSVVFTLDSFNKLKSFSEFLHATYGKLSPINGSEEFWLRMNIF